METHELVASANIDNKKLSLYDREGFKRMLQTHWEEQGKGPSRLWGTTMQTRWGGEERTTQGEPEQWQRGEFWNVDSNIKIWSAHEVRRNAAAANHDVHRHDQRIRVALPEHPRDEHRRKGITDRGERHCMSGMHGPDRGFLEAWGFDLGQRDRSGNPTPLWRPASNGRHFVSKKDYEATAYSPPTIARQRSAPASLKAQTDDDEMSHAGSTRERFNSQSRSPTIRLKSRAVLHDGYDHAVKREGARLACELHSPAHRSHADGMAHKDNLELSPGAIYNRKYRKFGEEAARKHITATEAAGKTTARTAAGRSALNQK